MLLVDLPSTAFGAHGGLLMFKKLTKTKAGAMKQVF